MFPAPCTIATAAVDADLVALLVVVLLSVMAGIIAWGSVERRKRRQAEQFILSQSAKRPAGEPHDEPNAAFAEQHRRLNDLQIAKLQSEVELLRGQVQASAHNPDRIDASKEYHELMVEKTKLEMDSLRLHIAEQRRRMEDWRVDND